MFQGKKVFDWWYQSKELYEENNYILVKTIINQIMEHILKILNNLVAIKW